MLIAGMVSFAELLLNLSLPQNEQDEFELEGETDFRGVGIGGAEVKLFSPDHFAWTEEHCEKVRENNAAPDKSILIFAVNNLDKQARHTLNCMKKIILLFCLFLTMNAFAQTTFDIQGHRGARGLMPENTIPAFLKALELGVNTLEMDTVVSKDNQLVVSHDPFFSSEISLDKNGSPIPVEKQTDYKIFDMTYSEIKLFDVGSLGNRRFPEQQKIKTYKPLLSEVFKETQKYIRKNRLKPTMYNIETKSTVAGDNIFNPPPAVFARLLYDEIVKNKMQKFVTIQSFDVRTLQEFKKFPVKMPLVLLVENKDGIEKNISNLGFQPDVYSPNYLLVDEQTVKYCREKKIKIIPWTVNEIADLERMKKFNLDGIITDYPDRAIKIFRK